MRNSMEEIVQKIQAMRIAKGWDKSDTPEILAKSVFVEAGELLECFEEEQFDVDRVCGELADVLMYALSLAHDLGRDPLHIIEDKFQDIDVRYPSL